MQSTLFLLAASAAVVLADSSSMGQAIVQNNCAYSVHLQNTPSMLSGYDYSIINQVLAPGESYTQTWTPTKQGGWSIKLSKTDDNWESDILQYEYTCQDDGIIWYDLSQVNGNPWDGDWLISAPDGAGCNPKQDAYRFWNDDAHGMQSSCPQATDITVTLCNKSGGSASNSSSSAPASSSVAPAPSYSAPAPSSSATTTATPTAVSTPSTTAAGLGSLLGNVLKFDDQGKAVDVEDKKAATPTTLATSVKAAAGNYVATVTDVVTHVANVYVTQRAEAPHLHHRHHARHGH